MDRRSERTRKSIRSAFISLIKEKEMTDISVSELAQRADIDRRTFYLHYSAISDISDEIIRETCDKLRERLSKNDEIHLPEIINIFFEIGKENIDFYRVIATIPFHNSIQRECLQLLDEIFTDYFFERSGMDETTFAYYANYLCAGLMGMYIRWFKNPNELSIEEFTEVAQEVIRNSCQLIEKIIPQ